MSSQRVYLSAQRRFIAFCKQDIKKVPDGFPLPADEHTLMRFCTMLADTVNYPSIKIYLSAVRSLHTDNGLPDPLINCLQLQNLLKGVKKVKDASTPARLLITVELMRAIHQSLDLRRSGSYDGLGCLLFGLLRFPTDWRVHRELRI